MTDQQYYLLTPNESLLTTWTLFSYPEEEKLASFEDAEDLRIHLKERDIDTVLIDADGNGSLVTIPIAWIWDGRPLIMSRRAMDLIKTT